MVSNETLLDISGVGGTTIFTDIVLTVLGAGALIGDYFDDTATFLLGFLPGSSKIDIQFKARAFPSSGTAQIYKGKLTYTKTLLWLVPITRTIFDKTENSLSSDLFLDNFPGGVNPQNEALEESGLESNFFFGYNYNLNLNLNLNFISAVSALDVGSGNTTLSEADYFKKFTAENPPTGNLAIPFDNFTTSFNNTNINEPHITFNRRNGDWLATELDNNANNQDIFNCTFVCDNSAIAGPSTICSTFNSYLYIAPAGGDNYNWTILGNSAFLEAGSTPNTIKVKRMLSNSGWVTLRVNIMSTRCGDVVLEKDIYVGAPTVDSIIEIDPNTINHISSANGNCDDIGLQLNFAPNNQDVLEIEWEKITTDVMWSREFDNSNDRNVIIYPNCNKTFEFRVRARNTCGWSNWQNLSYEIDNCNSDCGNGQSSGNISSANFEIYPVPADTNLYVKVKALADGVIIPNLDFNVKLFNSAGIKVIDVNPNMSPANINVSSLPAGTYTIIINYQNVTESHQIIIQ